MEVNLLAVCLTVAQGFTSPGPIIVDHNCTDLTLVPAPWIEAAKSELHIAYGHTSHGSQLTTGMTGLVTFTGGCGGPQFEYNNGGHNGALDLHDAAMPGDAGYYPQWVNETRAYLDNPAHFDTNVIMWAWCGQVAGYTEQEMTDRYLAPMTQLELDYPHVMFVYMTGHLDVRHRDVLDARNQQIRDYCRENNKILYDFADIESYDPNGFYWAYANDDCNVYKRDASTLLGNWAVWWQNSHVESVDWYQCPSAHSEPLNANLKAFSAWWMFARLAGWSGPHDLYVDKDSVHTSTGGQFRFDLDAGADHANGFYFLLGSVSGTSPGTPLILGPQLPLNWDAFTDTILVGANSSWAQGFSGQLDAFGRGVAFLDQGPLPVAAELLSMHFSYVLIPDGDYVSHTVSIRILP